MPDLNYSPGELGRELVKEMEQITENRIGAHSVDNARFNFRYLDRGKSLADLRGRLDHQGGAAVIIAAGPSIKRHDPIAALLETKYTGTIVATESAMAYCLKNGIVPDLVVTLDPHATRIVRWFGDPELDEEKIAADDYYRRQDMDTAFADELAFNEQVLDLIDRHGPSMKIALSTSASKAVVERVLDTGMEIFWWNPMLDDPASKDSTTREVFNLNGLPCVNGGGNVGSASWMMADAVLNKTSIALTGMDFSYYDGTPYRNTQYFHDAVALVGEDNLDSLFVRIFNPYLEKWFFTDPAYLWYKECFLDMARETESRTVNCTEGGILFGDGIEFMPLRKFLNTLD